MSYDTVALACRINRYGVSRHLCRRTVAVCDVAAQARPVKQRMPLQKGLGHYGRKQRQKVVAAAAQEEERVYLSLSDLIPFEVSERNRIEHCRLSKRVAFA